jgi:hypothetical protein
VIISHRRLERFVGHQRTLHYEEVINLLDPRLGNDGPERLAADVREQGASVHAPPDHRFVEQRHTVADVAQWRSWPVTCDKSFELV